MKAATRRRAIPMAWRVALLLGFAAVLPLGERALAAPAGLPAGLPELPVLSEATQHDIQSGIALRGYDPVAYRLEGRAVAGNPAYEVIHQGTVWRFLSAANRAAFRDAPEIYAPAFAGYDASAVAQGRAVDIDPREFAIVGSRLFLFRTAENRQRFLADPDLQHRADGQWSSVAQSLTR